MAAGTGLENDAGIDYAREVVARDRMATHLGMEMLEVADAHARLSIFVRSEYCNALSRAHGMLICSLADQCAAVAANTGKEQALVTELKVNYLAAAYPGQTLVGEARPLDRKRTLSLWEVRITEAERLIAVAQALTYSRPESSA
jgi:acyl-CoA thioesterase